MRAWVLSLVCLLIATPALADPPSCDHPPPIQPVPANATISVRIDPKPTGNSLPSVLDPQPAWQPRGGTVPFTLSGQQGSNLSAVKVMVCFGWKEKSWTASPHVWVTRTELTSVTYNAVVPRDLPSAPDGIERTGFAIVPLADMRIFAYGGDAGTGIDVIRPIGVTRPSVSMLAAVIGVALGLLMFWGCSRQRQVPGRGFLLWLISTKNGVASLSQLQIMLWTFVVGAAAIYVMALSGALIEITDGTLVLLGIAGVATLTSKLQNAQADGKAPTTSTTIAPPNAVTDIQAIACDEREIRLGWSAPPGGGAMGYVVDYAPAPADGSVPTTWTSAGDPVRAPQTTVMGLQPGTAYVFRVRATNLGGPGAPALTAQPISTSPPADTPPGAPPIVVGLRLLHPASRDHVHLGWAEAGQQDSYALQYRAHDRGDPWVAGVFGKAKDTSVTRTEAVLANLTPGTLYDVRIRAANQAGAGPWSIPITLWTMRDPQFSDLIISGDGRGEVDVTRVQMLFFTVVTALFVSMTVITSYTIPEIPSGFLLLMGISNGVYVTNKFI